VAVLGPGGIGGLLAALLARGGNSVEVLASESTARAIAEGGLRVESQRFGDFQVSVPSAIRLERPVDACLIAVKNTQLTEALERVPSEAVGGQKSIRVQAEGECDRREIGGDSPLGLPGPRHRGQREPFG